MTFGFKMIVRLLCFLFVFFSVQALPTSPNPYKMQVHRLKNGLEVIVIENHRAPLVMHILGIKAGTNDSPWGKSGLAHYLEHLMFKGSPSSAAGRIMKDVAYMGGEINAVTNSTHTFYYELAPVAQLEKLMALAAERLSHLEIKEEWATPEVNVVLEERSMRIENTPFGPFYETLNAMDVRHHPSRLPIIGWAHEIKTYTVKDALKFYQDWYAPNNAYLVVAGDITFQQVVDLAEKYYGPLASRALPTRLNLQEPPLVKGQQVLEMTSPVLDSAYYVERYTAPSFNVKDPQDFYALFVLQYVLDRPVTGRLNSIFIDKKVLASRFNISYQGLQGGSGYLSIDMLPNPQISLDRLEKTLQEEITRLCTTGVTAEEVAQAKAYIISFLGYVQDDITEVAETIVNLYGMGMPLDEIERWADRIQGVTVEQVNTLLRQVFRQSPRIKGRLRPVPLVKPVPVPLQKESSKS